MCNKQEMRAHFLHIRKQLSTKRRKRARELLRTQLYHKLSSHTSILSFYSLPKEIDTHLLNQQLATEGRLFLPKMEGEHLHLYHVTDLKSQLLRTKGNFFEPDIEKCTQHPAEKIDCALIPALGFDRENYRLGYGNGCYDRLLAKHSLLSIGIGFSEQLSLKCLPREEHDMPIDELFLL